ncbi:hypothetical protein K449DRAFT_430366 [Hypoxylon sp. EC38]|nr:hypothetical protein K449DRAFT_430366 [Hypoxylon sp. EC38]
MRPGVCIPISTTPSVELSSLLSPLDIQGICEQRLNISRKLQILVISLNLPPAPSLSLMFWKSRLLITMSTIEDPIPSTQDSVLETLLTAWKRALVYEIVPSDNISGTRVVGIIDGGSKYCLISSRAAKCAGLEIMPFEGKDRPTLEGFEEILKCQPVGWALAHIKQADLELHTTCRWRFLVVRTCKIDLLLGYVFNYKNNIEDIIAQAVRNGIWPTDYDNSHVRGDDVLVLMDSRSEEHRRRDIEEKRRQATEATKPIWLAIQEMKKSEGQGSKAERTTLDIGFHSKQPSSSFCQSTTASSSSAWDVLSTQDSTTLSYQDSSRRSTASSPWTILTSPDTASTSKSWGKKQ